MHRARNFTPDSFAQSRASAKRNKRKRRRRLSESEQHEADATALDRSSGQGEQITNQRFDSRTRIEPEPWARTISTQVPASEAASTQFELASRVAELEALVERIRYNTSDPQMTMVPMLGQAEDAIAASRNISSPPRTRSDPCVEATLHSRTSGDTYYIGKTAWTGIRHDKNVLFGAPALRECWTTFKEIARDYANWSRPSLLHTITLSSVPDNLRAAVLEMMPESCDCDVLLDRFLLTFNATHPIVDETQMRIEIDEFRTSESSKTMTWLGMYLGILAIGLQLPVAPLRPGRSMALHRVKGKEMMQSVKSLAFDSPATSNRPDLNTFQIMLLLLASNTLDIHYADGNDAKHGFLALTSRMAFALGLHREARYTNLVSAREAESRRSLWSTYKFFEVEHALQTGTPFLLRGSDADVLDPDPLHSSWPAYHRALARAIPLWARVLHVFHSSKAEMSGPALRDLSEQLSKLSLPVEPPHHSRAVQAEVSMAVQRAVFYSCHSRTIFMLHAMSPARCWEAVENKTFLNSAVTILCQQTELNAVIEQNTDARFAESWRHFAVSLLSWSSWHATDYVLANLRNSEGEGDSLFAILTASRPLLDKTLPVSASIIKVQMMYSALFANVKETLHLRKEQGASTGGVSAAHADAIVLTMRRALDECLTRYKSVVAYVKDTEDPPPALYKNLNQDQPQAMGVSIDSWQVNDWTHDMPGFNFDADWMKSWEL